MPTSLKDVAARAGVSARTVSNVVNGSGVVAPATRERVQQAVDELGYRPNAAARNLRTGRTGLVGLVVPEIDSPYFSEMAALLAVAVEGRSWTLLTDATGGDAERERRLLGGARRQLVDGLILSPWALTPDDIARHAGAVPLVLIGEHVPDGVVDHVAVDNVAAARAATAHLLALGRRRVAVVGVGANGAGATARLRLQGYHEALAAAGLPRDPALEAGTGALHRADGAAALRRLLDLPEPPDAVFCFTDQLALGALRVALERGLDVPGDLAVVGFDDIEDGRYATPSLTTVSPDKAATARLAVECLADRIAERAAVRAQGGTAPGEAPGGGGTAPARTVVVAHRLEVRESTVGRAVAPG
ncbi:LacI family DNA-binding transcriptional regulator [Aquipuribacter hungaricus]|uniref:LacI family DNA-binding transcriptional regulator n=1 Tax=Aquipuribacter hungaricus TaxID=545624 RepID=A0ABV7WDS4_9MICO